MRILQSNEMYVLYTDDSILAGPNLNELDAILQQVKDGGLDLTSDDGIEDFLGGNPRVDTPQSTEANPVDFDGPRLE